MEGIKSWHNRRWPQGLRNWKVNCGTLRFKVSEKDGVSVYGLGRFPDTRYLEPWHKLLSQAEELRAFIDANKGQLKTED